MIRIITIEVTVLLIYEDKLTNGETIKVIRHDEQSYENISTEYDTYITDCDVADFTFTFSTVGGVDRKRHYIITTYDYNDQHIALELPKDPFRKFVAMQRSGTLDELGVILIKLFRF